MFIEVLDLNQNSNVHALHVTLIYQTHLPYALTKGSFFDTIPFEEKVKMGNFSRGTNQSKSISFFFTFFNVLKASENLLFVNR